MSGNSAKGRKLPPLLPVEYCKLDRAARMLECEVEDLLHWGGTGAIRLLYFAKDLEAQSAFDKQQFEYLFKSGKFESLFRENVLVGMGISVDCDWMYPDKEELVSVFNNLLCNDGPGEFNELYALVTMNGLFAIDGDHSLNNLYISGNCKTFGLSLDYQGSPVWYHFLVSDPDFSIEKIFIEKQEMEKIYNAITTGTPLANEAKKVPHKITQTETMQRISNAKAAAERNSAPRAELVLSLLELVLGEDSSLIDNPYALYQRVNKQLREAKIIEPEITEQAFADILSKAKSARKDRLNNQS